MVVAIVFFAAGCGGKPTVKASADAPVAAAAAVQAKAEALTLAIMPLKAQGVEESEAALVTDMLRKEMAASGKFRVVEREQMEKIVAEKELKSLETEAGPVGAAKLMNAQCLGTGSFGKLMDNYVLSFRIVDVETGIMKGAGTAEGKNLDQVKKGIAKLVASF